ncbi:MAG: hypothetical protein SNJ74_12390, partial [Fimbriimonadaceae bacterium]
MGLRFRPVCVTLGISVVVVLSAAIGVATNFAGIARRHAEASRSDLACMKLIGDIERYDEVLTMSARMYAATGDPRWLGRYEEHERLLDSALARGRRLAPPIVGGIVAETAEANEALVAMERRSMALANSGRRNESLAILDSGAYDAHKRSYALGMRQAARNIEDR